MENPLEALRVLSLQLEHAVAEIAQKHDIENLKGPQGRTLYFLFKHQDRDVYVKDIEQMLNISKSVASNLVKRMEKNGYITIEPSEKDKRYKRLVLTQEGVSKIEPLEQFHLDMFQHLFVGIDPEDGKAVERVFEQLKTNLARFKGEKDV